MKSPFKKTKYEEQILNEINHFLRRETSDTRFMFVSATKVELNKDYSVAKVYWDTFDPGKRGDVKKAMTGVAGKLRTYLAGVLNVRHVPTISFFYDAQYEEELKITKILENEQRKESGS